MPNKKSPTETQVPKIIILIGRFFYRKIRHGSTVFFYTFMRMEITEFIHSVEVLLGVLLSGLGV